MDTLGEVMNCFEERRKRLMSEVERNAVVVIASAKVQPRNGDVNYPFRQDSFFYYLTGFNEEKAVLVLVKNAQGYNSYIFCQDQDPVHAVWSGAVLGVDAAPSYLKVDQAFAIDTLSVTLPKLVRDTSSLHMLMQQQSGFVQKIQKMCSPVTIHDVTDILSSMRLYKDATEITLIEQAASISAQGHIAAMQSTRPGILESAVEGAFLHAIMQQGCRQVAYESIVAGGENACVLHYTKNSDVLDAHAMLLIDAGGEFEGYASDISRTYPVNGVFDSVQRAIYEVVLDVQLQLIDMIRPGVRWCDIQHASEYAITKGLVELGILRGVPDALCKKGAHKAFYMHGFGHWLGLDVHDVGTYGEAGKRNCVLEPGMVLTVEPGVYIHTNADVKPHWRGIGVRIEDDILVTENGVKVLSSDVPKTVVEIEKIMV